VSSATVLTTTKMPKSMTRGPFAFRQVPGRTSDEVQRPCVLNGAGSRTRVLVSEALRWCKKKTSTGNRQSTNEKRSGLDACVIERDPARLFANHHGTAIMVWPDDQTSGCANLSTNGSASRTGLSQWTCKTNTKILSAAASSVPPLSGPELSALRTRHSGAVRGPPMSLYSHFLRTKTGR